jgi:dCMP deaminase
MTWDEYFINLLDYISIKSKDKTKTSAIIVGNEHEIRSTGFNGMVRGMNESDPIKWEKPEKYHWVEHAERNAIYNAARMGNSVNGCTMYVSHFPCVDCARGIIQSGIVEVIISPKNINAFRKADSIYQDHESRTIEMFRQAKVSLVIYGEDNLNGDMLEKEDLDNLWGV